MASEAICYDNKDDIHLKGDAELMNLCFSFVDSLAIRSAIELHIPDIINSHGKPMSLAEIGSKIESSSPDLQCLERVLRVVVRKKLLKLIHNKEPPLYALTPTSKWLLHDNELSHAPMFLTFTHPEFMAPWYELSSSIKEGGMPFVKAYGETLWEKGSREPEFNKMFNSGMASATKPTLNAIIEGYKHEFSKLEGTFLDVGGGIGKVVSAIVKNHPQIKGINFDQPHVIATAPKYPGVTHVGGDLFGEFPKADTVFIKSVLIDWRDDDCIKILNNCKKAVSGKEGKVIIVDIVLKPEGTDAFDDAKFKVDLLMMALYSGGKARTETEWEILLNKAGFARYNIIHIPAIYSIIEAFPN